MQVRFEKLVSTRKAPENLAGEHIELTARSKNARWELGFF